jgi:hypothetical protein
MRVAFLHGLESNPVSDKSKAVAKIFDYSYTPAMDYKNPNMFNEVLKEIKDRKIDLLVGSSMGGWFAYCISTLTGIPTILFNPALQGRPYEPTVKQGTNSTNHTIVLGRKDNVINPQKTYEWFKENGIGNAKFFWEGIGHRTPLDVFTKYVNVNESFGLSYDEFLLEELYKKY